MSTSTNPVPAPADVPPAPLDDLSPHATSVSIAVPAATAIATTSRQKQRNRAPARLPPALAWNESLCFNQPLGSCTKPQKGEALYCFLHSCLGTMADDTRCPNHVPNPAETRYCKTGWHQENARYHHVTELLTSRRTHARLEAERAAQEHAASAEFFTANFAANVDAPSPQGQGRSTASDSGSGSSSKGHGGERGWGAFGVDKWWVGEWRRGLGGGD